MLKVIGTKGIAEIIILFALVILSGFLLAVAAVKTMQVSILFSSLNSNKFAIISYVMDAALASTILLIILRRHKKHKNNILFKIFEGIVVTFTSFFVFLLVFALALKDYVSVTFIYALAIITAVLIVLLKDEFPRLRDIATMISGIGVGVILGFNFGFNYAIGILAAVAIYDYIFVFKTKEMQVLAKEFSSRNMAFLVSVSDLEVLSRDKVSKREYKEYIDYLTKSHEIDDPEFVKILKKGSLPIISQISLGEGDLSLPLMAVISAYYFISSNLFSAFIIAGSLFGIIFTMVMLKLYKHPLPAIPPLFSFISVFAGIGFLVTKVSSNTYLPVILIAAGAFVMLLDMITVAKNMHTLHKQREEAKRASKRNNRSITL